MGGAQVARGYLGQTELTRQKFVPDPFSDVSGARMYRTGDWVRWLPNGEIDFIGRKDGQIQIRGRRVELGEIEAAISAHDTVQQICCVPWMDDGMPAAVIAHVVLKRASENFVTELRTYLQPLLPDYMVPSKFVVHDALPLTPQGKINRAALIALRPTASNAGTHTITRSDRLEQKLARLWHTLLPAAASSPSDATFQMLGGDSLLALKLILGVEDIIGQQLELSAFLVQPTFTGLCAAVKMRQAREKFEPLLELCKTGTRPPLFILYGHTGDIELGMNLAEGLGDDQPVYGIRSPVLADSSHLPVSIEAAATEAIGFIRTVQSHGAPALVGYSWAGTLGFEIARQLWVKEKQHCFTAIIGGEGPPFPVSPVLRVAHFVRYFPAWLLSLVADRENRRRRLARWRGMISGATHSLAQKENIFEMPDWVKSPVSLHMIGLLQKYRPVSRMDLSLAVIRETEDFHPSVHPLHYHKSGQLPDAGWDHWTLRPNHIYWVKGNHVSIIKPPIVEKVGRIIREAYDRYLSETGRPGK